MNSRAVLWRRSRALRALLALVFVALVLRLVAVQELSHSRYSALSSAELTQASSLSSSVLRGGIFDRNGKVLAESVSKPTVVADPLLIKDARAEASKLAPVLGVPASVLAQEMSGHSGFAYLAHRVASSVAAKVTSLNLTGINLVPQSQLVQPAGQLALPVIGTVGVAGTGLSGLEYQYQAALAGTAGKPPVGLELTIDESLQYVAEQALGAEIVASHAASGVAIVMDVKTGDVLAEADLRASSSTSVSAAPTTAQAANQSGATLTSPVDVLPAGVSEAPSNSALTQVYEPGSVFKLVTFSSALQHGVIVPHQRFTVPGALPLGAYVFHDAESHGTESLSVEQILARSSNIGTIEIAQRLGETRLLAQIGNLGFGKPTGLNFPGESQGLIPGPTTWSGSSIGSTPIGQADSVTPQQLIDAYNAAANGGVMVQPRLVRGVVGANGSVTPTPPSPTRRVIAAKADAEVTKMLEGVVTSQGTGVKAAVSGYQVAGKTGTSQIPYAHKLGYIPGAFFGTFVGFAPAQDPVLTALVVLDHPTPIYGGSVAAPVFSKIMGYALHHFGIPASAAVGTGTPSGALGGTGSATAPASAAAVG